MELVGIVHAHSTYSYDAKLTLRELRDLCIKNGVHFVCMTEHTDEMTKESAASFVKECESLSDEIFRFIPGFEVPYKHAHVLMLGLREWIDTYAKTTVALRAWTEKSVFVVLAHPVRNQFKVEDELLNQIHAVEVWNQQYDGKRVPRVHSLKLFDSMKKKKPELIAIGGIDFHRIEHFSAPTIHLKCDVFDEVSIFEKLKIGAFTIVSKQALVYGSLPSAAEVIHKHRIESHISVLIIILGKWVNRILAHLGIRLPKSLKQLVRSRL